VASEYSVNIKLNTQQVKKDLQTIKGEIGKVGQSKSKGAKKSLTDTEQQLRLENQSLRIQNQGYGLTLKSLPLAEKGVDLAKIAKNISEGIGDAKKFEFDQAKKSLLVADQQIKKQQILAKANEDVNKKVKPLNPLSSESPVQQALKEMDDKTKKDRKQAILNRRKSISLGKDLVKIKVNEGKATAKNIELEAKQLAKQTERLNAAISPKGDFSRLSDRQSRDVEGRRTFMNNPLARRGIPMPTKGFDFQSALISGGFPLLFGQGPVTAAAGALGGGIGGMFGQMGGFAGGIAATAVVQSINQAIAAMSELGKAMGPFTQNSQALTDSLGLQGSAEEARIKLIEESEGKTAAFNASMQLMTTRIGEDGVKNLEKFGETTRLLGSEMSLAITQLHALGAGIANFVLNITGLKEGLEASAATRSVADAAARGDTAAQGLVDRRQKIEAMGGQGGEGARKRAALAVLEAEEKIFAVRQNTIIQAEVMAGKFNSMVRSLEAEKEEAERLVELRESGLNPAIAKTIAALEKEARLAKDLIDAEIELLLAEQARTGELGEADQTRLTTLEAQRDKIDESVEGTTKLVKETENLNDKANDTVDAFTKLRDTIAQDIGNGLKDLITGAKSLNEVLSNILANMANQFLNLGIFGNFAGTFKPGEGLLGRIFPKADGGPVKAGGKYVVGERGPELFSPGRSGMITPNHALGGSTNVTVNVDASGSSVEGDANQAEQLGSAISEAIQAELIQQKRPGGILYN